LGVPRGLWNAAYREGEGLFEFGGDIHDLNYWYFDPNAALNVLDKYFKAGGAIVDDPSLVVDGVIGPTLDALNREEYGEAGGEFAALLVFGILDPFKGGGKAGRVGSSINKMVPDDVPTITPLFTPKNAHELINSQGSVVLELFGGKTGKVEGTINVDFIAEQGINADLLTDKLSFIPDNQVDEIITFNPYISQEFGGTGILDYLPEAARVLKPGGRIVISGTKNNKFTRINTNVDLDSLNLRLVEKQIPLPERFSHLTFHTTNGRELHKRKIFTTILEKK